MLGFFFFKQKTAYEMRISDWSSDVCSSDLQVGAFDANARCHGDRPEIEVRHRISRGDILAKIEITQRRIGKRRCLVENEISGIGRVGGEGIDQAGVDHRRNQIIMAAADTRNRSEEHTSELPTLQRIS